MKNLNLILVIFNPILMIQKSTKIVLISNLILYIL